MTRSEVRILVGGIAAQVKTYVEQKIAANNADVVEKKIEAAIRPLQEQNAALQEQVKALEVQTKELQGREYQGVWDGGQTAYSKGAMVTRSGSLWVSKVDMNRTTPGQHKHWQLAVKAGAPGKDGQDAR